MTNILTRLDGPFATEQYGNQGELAEVVTVLDCGQALYEAIVACWVLRSGLCERQQPLEAS